MREHKPLSLRDLPVRGRRVLVRLGINVPIKNKKVLNDFRIRKVLPTLRYLKEQGAQMILIGHIENKDGSSFVPVVDILKDYLDVTFVRRWSPESLNEDIGHIENGSAVMLENLRMYTEEKDNDVLFAKALASVADCYVNEAFSVSHRTHASIIGVPQFIPGAQGMLFEAECAHLSRALDPVHPFLFILGGAKFSTKIPLIEKFIHKADTVFVGGALSNTFFLESGYELGHSQVEQDETFPIERFRAQKNLLLPTDVAVSTGTYHDRRVTDPSEVTRDEMILDAGPETLTELSRRIEKAMLVVWNGPLGDYEKGFSDGTVELARKVAEAKATTIVGGGDTVASIAELDMEDSFTFLSTGGGAMLDFLANETLPGIEALKHSPPLPDR